MEDVSRKVLFLFLDLSILEGMKLQSILESHLKLCLTSIWRTGLLRASIPLCCTQEMVKSKEGQGWVPGSFSFTEQPNRK